VEEAAVVVLVLALEVLVALEQVLQVAAQTQVLILVLAVVVQPTHIQALNLPAVMVVQVSW
jgi:hypothetical protein